MGRWLKKLDNMPKRELTKPTEGACVSFVSTSSEAFHKKIPEKIESIDFVRGCCNQFAVEPKQVIDHLLSLDDEQDIINGIVPAESLRTHIQLWINTGKQHYSGKGS